MSFKAKMKGWKRRIVHLLILGLVVGSTPYVPAQAQTDVSYLSEKGEVQSISGGDEQVQSNPEEQKFLTEYEVAEVSETNISEITPVLRRNTLYYEVDEIEITEVLDSINITFDDGTVENCGTWTGEWHAYGFKYSLLDLEGNLQQRDENNKYPVGNYIYQVYIEGSEISCEIPVEVVALQDVATELTVGGTVSGLSPMVDSHKVTEWVEGHWVKMELSKPGVYEISLSASSGWMQINGPNSSWGWYGSTHEEIEVSETETGTYYCYVKSEETFDVTLTRNAVVTQINPKMIRDTFYYEIESLEIYNIIESLELEFDDDTEGSCVPWDELWFSCNIRYDIFDSEGNYIQYDNNNRCPIGNYVLKFWVDGSVVSCEVPLKVISLADVATELVPGETVSGLTASENPETFDYKNYDNCHLFKMDLVAGDYELSKTAGGMLWLIYPDYSSESWNSSTFRAFTAEEPGTYYCYVKGSEVFDVTLTKNPEVTAIRPVIANDMFYYEIQNLNVSNIVSSLELTIDGEKEESCEPWSNLWYDYDLNYHIYDLEGNYAQTDDDNNYPVGDYICKIYVYGKDVSCEVPVKIVSLNDVATKLVLGETVTGLSGTDNYTDDEDLEGGHWLKAEFTRAGRYELEKTAGGVLSTIYPNGNSGSFDDTTSASITISQPVTYYFFVKGNKTFDVTLTRIPEVTEMHANVKNDTFYYEVQGVYVGEIIDTLELQLDDGTEATCSPWDTIWNRQNISYNMFDLEGNYAEYDENGHYPVGNYIFKVYDSSKSISCEIPVTVVSVADVATELAEGETITGLSGTEDYSQNDYKNGHWFKVEFTEPGIYEFSKSADGYMLLETLDNSGHTWYNSQHLNKKVSESETGIYYWYVKGEETFDVTFRKLPEVTEMKPEVKRDTFYYEMENMSFGEIVDSLELVFEDGTNATCELYDDVWFQYSFSYRILDLEGNYAPTDGNNKYPVGDYICRIEAFECDEICEIPIKVVSVDNEAIELAEGETISGLSGTDGYADGDYTEGHWLKLEVTEPGTYKLSKNVSGMLEMGYMGRILCSFYDTTSVQITLYETGSYYCYVKGNDTFDVTWTKLPEITAINVVVGRDTFYYEVENTPLRSLIASVELTFDDGTVENCQLWDSFWYNYNLSYDILDTEGNYVSTDMYNKYPIGNYICKIFTHTNGVGCEVPIKVVPLKDAPEDVPQMPKDAVPILEAAMGIYKLEIPETGLYELTVTGKNAGYGYVDIYDVTGKSVRSKSFRGANLYSIGLLDKGSYYVKFTYYNNEIAVFVKIAPAEPLASLKYSGDKVVLNYGEWGYKIEGDISSNFSKNPLTPNTFLSSNNLSLPIHIDGIQSDGSVVDILFRGAKWSAYMCSYMLLNKDGSNVYTDYNGYLANGEYDLKISAYGGASVAIPLQVVGGPLDLNTLKYTGEVQEFKYGTWGYDTKQLLSGNQIDTPLKANTDLNQLSYGNNILAIDFTVTAESKTGDTENISYKSLQWNRYKIKTYFYDAEGNSVSTDKDGYLPVGSYIMKCITYSGVICEIPFNVYPDAGKIAEDQLETAVDEMLEAAEVLSDETLVNANAEEKKAVVTELLQKVEEIYAEQDISEIGAASAQKAVELSSKLVEVEKQIAELLDTSVIVEAQDNEAADMNLAIQNALLSVPAGENAEVRVSATEIPENAQVKEDQAVAIKLELIAEGEEKMQLQAPVIITMKVPDSINRDEEIVVYHYSDNENLVEVVSVILNGDGTMSFVTGSFSTFVVANTSAGVEITGKVSSATSDSTVDNTTTIKLLDANKTVIAQTAVTETEGSYTLSDVPAGTYTLQVSKEDHVTREYAVEVDTEAVTVNVEIWLKGDVNGDGDVTVKDKKVIFNHMEGTSTLTDYAFAVGDVDGNGDIVAKDKKMIYNHIEGNSLLW